jgi:DNA-binding response OmpR family regulator
MLSNIVPTEPRPRLLVVDDEPRLFDLLVDELQEEGYDVGYAQDGATCWLALMAEPAPDLVLLDWTLPDVNGPDLCRRMRESGIKTPVLMLTGHDDVTDRVLALDAGVDDYLVKPFALDELFARLRALRRRRWAANGEEADQFLQKADLLVNLTRQEVQRAGIVLPLTAMEYRLLLQLLQGEERRYPADELLRAVWGEGHQNDRILLDVYVESLMRKIDDQHAQPLLQRFDDGGLRLRTR